jgi:molybdopterin-biosynthesis enzyme MoeA-like protein
MSFGLIVIGDEILSGKRQDKHFSQVVSLLSARGLQLSWAAVLGDDRDRLTDVLRGSFERGDRVISCGGIGATPDDHTRQAAAAALGVPLVAHPEAVELITERCREMAREGKGSADMSLPENRQRLKMGEFPEGSRIIPNPYNKIPGFSLADHWFVPGFPVMAWPMVEWVLDHQYRQLHHRLTLVDRSMILHDLAESTITPLMEAVERDFPQAKVYSLPSMGEGGLRRHIELGVKGEEAVVGPAFAALERGVAALRNTERA